MKRILNTIQKGGALKYVFAPVLLLVFSFMFLKLEKQYASLEEDKKIIIPLQSYTLVKKKKKLKEKISSEQIIEKGKGRQVAGTDDLEEAYLGKVQAIVNSQKSYPPYESRLGVEDSVQVRVVILPNGSIDTFAIVNKSKFGGFNEEVERMIHDSMLPPFPQGLDKEYIALKFYIKFTLNENG